MNAESMMLHAVSIVGKARALKSRNKIAAIFELKKGVRMMNEAIIMEPNNIENRKYRLRHLLGISMNSPLSFFNKVKEDLLFFDTRFSILNNEDQSYYLSALGEYEIYIGNRDRGISILQRVVDNYNDTSMYNYTKVFLETIGE